MRTHLDIHRIAKLIQQQLKQCELKDELDLDTIEKVLMSQFSFVKQTMEQGDLQDILLPYLGKFRVKPFRRQYLEGKGKHPIKK